MKRRMLASLLTALVTALGFVIVGQTAASAHTAGAQGSWAKADYSTQVGYTRVVVDPQVYALIAGGGVTPAPIGGAKAFAYKNTLAARFPITGFAVSNLRLKHSGGLSLTRGSQSISLSNFYVDLARGKVSGEVPGVGRVDLFSLAVSTRLDLGLVRLQLTDTAANALNATFQVSVFSAGDTFGYATPQPLSRF